jgi:CubicO group peptidase (beta-lactamase class C family)
MQSALKLVLAFVLAIALSAQAHAEPGKSWQNMPPATAGWGSAALRLGEGYFKAQNPTALMIVQDGRVVAAWGDVGRKVNLASVRKSLLGALFGIAVAEKQISLGSTLAGLGIDDKPPGLSAVEKQATVRDLLMARSGVYHPSAYETGAMRRSRPERASHAAGSFWFYNNWDFNALGTIYRRATGKDIFEGFARRIGEPVGMEDFSARDGRYVSEPSSMHPAYPFSLSARDAARFGLLMANGGRWQGRQIVPESWVVDSMTPYSATDRSDRGYGYLWWTLRSDQFGLGAAMASGYGGQAIAVMPSKRLVVVQTVDLKSGKKAVRTSRFVDFLGKLVAAAP